MSKELHNVYVFGSLRLDPDGRMLTRNGEPIPLPPKTFDLLVLMVASEGRLLPKQQLMNALWQESFVEEGSLTYQVSTLRKALGAEGSTWIETVPKSGYRFRAPVSVEESDDTVSNPNLKGADASVAVTGDRGSTWKWLWIGSMLMLFPASFLMWREKAKSELGDKLSSPRPLTSYLGSEMSPSLSPDGNQVAFQWNGPTADNNDIYVIPIGAAQPLRLTTNAQLDANPAWSPDGRQIAFLRQVSDSQLFDIVLAPATGGRERKLGQIQSPLRQNWALSSLAWAPDGLSVTAAHWITEESSMSLVSIPLAPGDPVRLTHAPPNCAGDRHPAWSPKGNRLAFIRQSSCCDFQLMMATAGGKPKEIARRSSNSFIRGGLAWTHDTKALIWAFGGKLWRVPVDGDTARPLLEAGNNALELSISNDGRRLVYAQANEDFDIWSLDVSGSDQAQRKLISSTKAEALARFSPDGNSIAFSSDRSGTFEIWVAESNGSNPLKLTNLGNCGSPRWSHDGQWIVFDSAAEGNPEIYIISTSGGTPRRLTRNPAEDVIGAWSHDGLWVYFTSNRSGTDQIWKIDAHSGGEPSARAEPITRTGGAAPTASSDGSYLYYAARKHGSGNSLLRLDLKSGSEVTIIPALRSDSWGYSLSRDGVYYADFDKTQEGADTQWKLRHFDPDRRTLRNLVDLPPPVLPGFGYRVEVSPDGQTFLLARIEDRGSDLVLLEGVR
jgi:Tol biopolymer transport system component/DNA-binding winged helix-turn-helix (wHTH) protein